jgi:hypothetical protein
MADDTPFEKNDGKRKFLCFVCGRGYKEVQEFRTHILEEHEQGREYLLCPLARCQQPVRDLKAHFKAKHPGDQVPNFGPMKALIWKDWSSKGGKKVGKTRTPWKDGSFTSIKMNGTEIHYRSRWECQCYECLEMLTEVVAYHGEPVKIPYLFKGESHTYNPDILVQLDDGTTELWEIKPQDQTHWDINQAKWDAAKAFCEARGWKFVVITEKVLDRLKKQARRPK